MQANTVTLVGLRPRQPEEIIGERQLAPATSQAVRQAFAALDVYLNTRCPDPALVQLRNLQAMTVRHEERIRGAIPEIQGVGFLGWYKDVASASASLQDATHLVQRRCAAFVGEQLFIQRELGQPPVAHPPLTMVQRGIVAVARNETEALLQTIHVLDRTLTDSGVRTRAF